MNLSELFIRRPITTTLIMLGITVFGVMAYRLLARQRSPGYRLSHHSGERESPRGQPTDRGVGCSPAARKAVLEHRWPELDQLDEFARQHEHHASIRLEPQYRRRRPGCAVDDCEDAAPAPTPDAHAALVPESQSRGSTCRPPRATVTHLAHLDGRRVRRINHGAAHFDSKRRRAGGSVWRRQIRRAHRHRPPETLGVWDRSRRSGQRNRERERESANRHDVRPRTRSSPSSPMASS